MSRTCMPKAACRKLHTRRPLQGPAPSPKPTGRAPGPTGFCYPPCPYPCIYVPLSFCACPYLPMSAFVPLACAPACAPAPGGRPGPAWTPALMMCFPSQRSTHSCAMQRLQSACDKLHASSPTPDGAMHVSEQGLLPGECQAAPGSFAELALLLYSCTAPCTDPHWTLSWE